MKKWISMLMAILITLSLLPTAWAADVDDVSSTAEAVREEAVPQVNLPEEEAQQPEPALEMEMEETAPALLSTSGDIDDLLVEKGFNVPKLEQQEQQFNVDVPAWSSFNDLASLDYSAKGKVGEVTLTLKTATAEAWNAAYSQSNQWFNALDQVRCVISYYAPDDAVSFSYCIADENSSDLSDFINGNYTDKRNESGCYMGFPIAEIENVDGEERICSTTPYTLYYLVVWRNSSDEIVGRYALKVNIKTEEFSHPTGSETVMTALKNAGFNTAPAWGSLVEVDMPDELVEGTDYTLRYDSTTGHISIKLMPGNPDHWMRAYETLLQRNERESWTEGNSMFYAMLGFPNPTSAEEVLMSPGNCALDTLANNNTYDWSKASAIQMSSAKTGWTLTMGSAEIDENGNALISFEKGVVAAGYYAVAYGDGSGSLVGADQEPKRAVSVSIEVTENFGYQWNTRIDKQLTEAGFVAPQKDVGNAETPGTFFVEMPAGLVEDTDYTYSYNSATGELVITLLEGSIADWKHAYLDSLISDKGNDIFFSVCLRLTDNAVSCAQWCGNWDYQLLLDSSSCSWSNVSSGFALCGNGFPVADTQENSSGETTISVSAGMERYYYGVVCTDSGGQTTKYLLKVTIQSGSSFTHTVASPEIRKLDTSADGGRFTLNTYNPNGISDPWSFLVWENGRIVLSPKTGLTLAGITGDLSIGDFSVTAPQGYTLQSCYIDYFSMGNEVVRKADTDENGGSVLGISVFDTTTGGSARYVLRWCSSNASQRDILELLDVRVDGQPLGKLSSSAGQPNATDVQAMYEYLTQNTVPSAGEAACDVNLDGAVDVYDLQYLYEFVTGI